MAAPVPDAATVELDHSTAHPVRRAALWVSKAISFVVYLYVIVVEIILLLGFLLLLLGANPSSSFVEWVYRSLDRAMRPFRGIFEPIELGVNQADVPSVLETSVLFAMVVYAILALVIHALLTWLDSRIDRIDRMDEELRRQQLINAQMAATMAAQQAASAQQAAPMATDAPGDTAASPPAATDPTPPAPPPAG